MSRKRQRPLFDTKQTVSLRTNKADPTEVTTKVIGGAPKKLSKPLKRHLEKVKRQNPAEYDRQMAAIGGS